MAVDSDSDSDSSIPLAIPGGGPLTFLPVQQSQNSPNNGHKSSSDSESDSDSDSDSTSIGIPGGNNNKLTFIAVHNKQNDSSSSSSDDNDDNNDNNDNNEDKNDNNNNNNDHMKILSYDSDGTSEDIEEEEEEEEKDDNIWDLVYMTSSPLAYVDSDRVIPLELLDVSRETEQIMSVLSSANRKLCVCHLIATSGNLIKAMTHSCRILHYSGHGFPSYLAFEDENSIGDTHMLSNNVFKNICLNKNKNKNKNKNHKNHKNRNKNKNKLKFVFTSACHSENVGLSFVSAGVPHVVSIDTKFEVSDEGAMTFTKYFYEALLCGRTIIDSFNFAKQSVQFISSSAKRDFEKFKLLPENGNHNVTLFNGKDNKLLKGKILNKTPLIPPNNLPITICPFIGRSIEMREIIHSFMIKKNENCRILNIYGDNGVGKTAITIMISRYLNDRKIYFNDGIYYINSMKLISNEESITLTEMINKIISNINIKKKIKIMDKLDTNELINNLKLFCRYGLFIIDDIDQLISYYKINNIDLNKELFNVIFKILLQVSEKIKFIIISKKICSKIYNNQSSNNIGNVSTKAYCLKRLSSTDTSNLFAKLTAMTWRPNDIKENIDIMSILKNNPLQIHELAKLKNQWDCKTLTKLVEIYNFKNKLERKHNMHMMNTKNIIDEKKQNREYLIQQNIQNVSAQQVWRKAHGMMICHYHKIFEILKYDFIEFTFSKRKLEQNNLIECFRILGMNNDLTINIEKFDIIYQWFNGLTRLVQILSNYYNKINPIIIHGFVSRDDSHKMLLNQNHHIPIGTFIIRFRYKQPKSIAISYKQTNNKVSNLKCDLSNNNDSTFICGTKLLPLPEFILTFKPLKYLYNKTSPIPKEKIFSTPNISSSASPSFNNSHSLHPSHYNNNNNNNPHLHSSYHAKSYGPPLSKTHQSNY